MLHFTEDRYRWTLEHLVDHVRVFLDLWQDRLVEAGLRPATPDPTKLEKREAMSDLSISNLVWMHDQAKLIDENLRVGSPTNMYVLRLRVWLDWLQAIGAPGLDGAPEDIQKLGQPRETRGMVVDREVGRPVIRDGEIFVNVGDLCDVCNQPIENDTELTIQKVRNRAKPIGAVVAHKGCILIPKDAKVVTPEEFVRS